MRYIMIATPPVQTVEQFDAVTAAAGNPEGLVGRFCGRTEDGALRVITLWASQEHCERFVAERLGPALARVLGPEPAGKPETLGLHVLRSWTPEPVG